MNAAIADIRLTGGWLPVIVDLAAIVLTVLLVGLLALPVRRAGGLSAGNNHRVRRPQDRDRCRQIHPPGC